MNIRSFGKSMILLQANGEDFNLWNMERSKRRWVCSFAEGKIAYYVPNLFNLLGISQYFCWRWIIFVGNMLGISQYFSWRWIIFVGAVHRQLLIKLAKMNESKPLYIEFFCIIHLAQMHFTHYLIKNKSLKL